MGRPPIGAEPGRSSGLSVEHDAPVSSTRFRGSLVRSAWSRGGFWNALIASRDEVVLTRWPRRPVAVRRADTRAVYFETVALPLWWGTNVRFDTDGPGSKYVFVVSRPSRLRECLTTLDWPVVELDRVNTRSLLRRAVRRTR